MDDSQLQRHIETLNRQDERARREGLASLAASLGRGGVTRVAALSGMARSTLNRGLKDLGDPPSDVNGTRRIRRAGGGRKLVSLVQPGIEADLEALIAPEERGDPMSPLRWTTKSLRHLRDALREKGRRVSHESVRGLLRKMGYSLKGNRKTLEGADHPDRNAQWEEIDRIGQKFLTEGQPLMSVDAKKKEHIGRYANRGREWGPKAVYKEVNTHDFVDEKLGKAIPYGIYDIGEDEGFVNVGIDHDTAAFAVESIGRWWDIRGSQRYPEAKYLMITADGGGSNSSRVRRWKTELQKFAERTGLCVWVFHFPPGTSKWNRIEHRLFSRITMNWRARPLISIEVVVNLIQNTTTKSGKRVSVTVDRNSYLTGQKPSNEEIAGLKMVQSTFHGEWNYIIAPRKVWDRWDAQDREKVIV